MSKCVDCAHFVEDSDGYRYCFSNFKNGIVAPALHILRDFDVSKEHGCCTFCAKKTVPSKSCHHCTHRGSIGHDVCKAVGLKSGLHACIEDAEVAAKDCAHYEWDGMP